MTLPRSTPALMAIVGIALIAVSLLTLATEAGAKSPAKVYDGETFTVKPDTISDFDLNSGKRRVELMIGGPDGTRESPGAIRWKSWSADRAVGIGSGWTKGCSKSCGLRGPWNGEKVRVTAFKRNKDRFARVKVTQPSGWMTNPSAERGDYRIAMVYTGFSRPGSGWFVFAFSDGLPIRTH